MKVLRWRLWVLMTLVLVCALGIKAVLVVQARRAAIERRAWLLSEFNSPPRTPAVEADLVGLLGDSDAAVRFQALRMLDRIDATAPAMIPPLMALLGDHDPVFPPIPGPPGAGPDRREGPGHDPAFNRAAGDRDRRGGLRE